MPQQADVTVALTRHLHVDQHMKGISGLDSLQTCAGFQADVLPATDTQSLRFLTPCLGTALGRMFAYDTSAHHGRRMASERKLTSGSGVTVPSIAALEVHKAQWCSSKLDKAQVHQESGRFDGKHLPFWKCPAN